MKKLFKLLAFTFFVSACSSTIEKSGEIELKNGDDLAISVKYKISKPEYDRFVKEFTKDDFIKMAQSASSKAKNTCKYTPTYDPKEIYFMYMQDTVVVTVDYQAKNAMGVPDALMSYSYFKDGKRIN